jgi:glycosyltransferase involved in cell wall biosynthesis
MIRGAREVSLSELQVSSDRAVPLREQVWPPGAVPVVSVCCLTFNHEPFIRRCLDGFLMQETTFPVEVLIHDDASTDGTAAIVREYEARYPGILRPIYQSENQRSRGVRPNIRFNYPRARGRYIALCEGDDYWTDPLQLQTQIEFLEAHPEYVVCYHRVTEVDEQGNDLGDRTDPKFRRDYSARELMMGAWAHPATRCFRNVLKEYPPEIDRVLNVDVFLSVLLGEHGKGKYLGEIRPPAYRQHKGSIWSSLDREEKQFQTLNTRLQIYLYHLRTKDRELAVDYLLEAVIPAVEQVFPERNPILARRRLLEFTIHQHRARESSGIVRAARQVWRIWDYALRRVGLRSPAR